MLSDLVKVTLYLDWTPNTNHSGFYRAAQRGYYQAEGLEVCFRHPGEDGYQDTPAKAVARGDADFGLGPSESVFSFACREDRPLLVAIGTVLQKDASAIAVLADSDISSPRDLDGKIYASYRARYEDAIIRKMVANDGGKGEVHMTYPNKLSCWEEVLRGNADATWIFEPWEGVELKQKNQAHRSFSLEEYGISYGYSPVLFTRQDLKESNLIRRFLRASQLGFQEVIDNPQLGVEAIKEFVPDRESSESFLLQSQQCWNQFALEKELKPLEHRIEKWELFLKNLLGNEFIPEHERKLLNQIRLEEMVV